MMPNQPTLAGSQYTGAGHGGPGGPVRSGRIIEGEAIVISAEDMANAQYESRWTSLARDCYQASVNFTEANMQTQWERNLANFQNRHPPGSKYHTDAYSTRNRGFRPKIRTVVRKNEAEAAAAFFSNNRVVSVSAGNQDDPEQVVSATIGQELLDETLRGRIPWFQILIGAIQEAQVTNIVCSSQGWEYEEGICDKPVIRLVAPENILFDPAADWTDIAGSTPYLIELIPMNVDAVRTRMEKSDDKTGEPPWKSLPDNKLLAATRQDFDPIRQARQTENKQDPHARNNFTRPAQYELVWVHRNIARVRGEDWLWYTLGTETLLSDPVPLLDVFPHLKPRERPYVIGHGTIEAFKTHPAALAELGQGLQAEGNDINNQRRDNVALVLNKRYLKKKGAVVDLAALQRSTPGGVVEVQDIQNDLRELEFNDVTASSYREQDMLNADSDSLLGDFNAGSLSTNRRMNETVGGMNLLSQSMNKLTDYLIQTFAVTWVLPTMSQLLRMLQMYETDTNLIAIAASKGKVWQRFGVRQITDQMLMHDLTTNINVGIGATDPQKRLANLGAGMSMVAQMRPDIAQKVDGERLVSEIFGALGFGDGKGLFPDLGNEPSPEVQQLQQQLQEMQKIVDTRQLESQTRLGVAQISADARLEGEEIKARLSLLETQISREDSNTKRGELLLQKRALLMKMVEMEMANLQNDQDREENKTRQSNVTNSPAGVIANDQYGNVPQALH